MTIHVEPFLRRIQVEGACCLLRAGKEDSHRRYHPKCPRNPFAEKVQYHDQLTSQCRSRHYEKNYRHFLQVHSEDVRFVHVCRDKTEDDLLLHIICLSWTRLPSCASVSGRTHSQTRLNVKRSFLREEKNTMRKAQSRSRTMDLVITNDVL